MSRPGDYLQARRQPWEQAGIPGGSHGRGAGREKVVLLAGVSVDYYMRLERGPPPAKPALRIRVGDYDQGAAFGSMLHADGYQGHAG